jgi:hypothetical protein
MATGDVLSGDKVTIWIESAGAIYSALTNAYNSEVTNFNQEGGAIDYESIAVFGGFIDSKKPKEQLTITMDVILRYGADATQWEILNGSTDKKMICIQATDGTNYYWKAYNNVRVVNFDTEFEAEGEWRGTMTFKLSATDADGKVNIKYGATGAATHATNGVTAWT